MATIGVRRERIVIQQPASTPDGKGGRAVTWSTAATVWASVRPATAPAERLQSQALQAIVGYDVEINYADYPTVSTTMRVQWTPYRGSTQTLQIHGVTAVLGQRHTLLLACSEVQP